MKILLLDNYDSFTYNLMQMVEDIIGEEIDVIKNDKLNLKDVSIYDAIILSPGPGIPSEAGKLLEVIKNYADKIPILGVCLGHQAMVEAFGGGLKQLEKVYHGIGVQLVLKDLDILFEGLTDPIQVGRYHSWVVDAESLPQDFVVTSTDEKGIVMSFKHKEYAIHGVQFHPESILTPQGKQMLTNWLSSIS